MSKPKNQKGGFFAHPLGVPKELSQTTEILWAQPPNT